MGQTPAALVLKRAKVLRRELRQYLSTPAAAQADLCGQLYNAVQTVLLYSLTATPTKNRDGQEHIGAGGSLLAQVSTPAMLNLPQVGNASTGQHAPYATPWDDANFPISLVTLAKSVCTSFRHNAIMRTRKRGHVLSGIDDGNDAATMLRSQAWLVDQVGIIGTARRLSVEGTFLPLCFDASVPVAVREVPFSCARRKLRR